MVEFDDTLTALLGTNGTGKSAVLAALSKVFGLVKSDRTLAKSDFHRTPGMREDTPITLMIELRFEFPELEDSEGDTSAAAAMFRNLTISEPEKGPYCIARLKAEWTPGLTAEGEIEENLNWVLGKDGDGNDELRSISGAQRSMIAVHYIPATRDPIRHIRQSAGSVLHTFLKAVRWSETTKGMVLDQAEQIRSSIASEAGVESLNQLIESCWGELHREGTHSKVAIQPVTKKFEELIRQVDMVFSPGDSEEESSIEQLSDGQRSLFYIALVAMSFDIRNELESEGEDHGFEIDQIRAPALTLLAVEEPENHVAPQYLGRIAALLKRIGSESTGQVVITSHSASVMARVEPESVLHLRLDSATRRSSIKRLTLPAGVDERDKYVREAVRAYPELYFARFVVLGEGASEEIVIPRVMKAMYGRELDEALISFVPLGGRHVNHMWKLLNDLGIPHVTLLDLDFGREGGGWGRIKYALEQLLKLGVEEKPLLGEVTREQLSKMHTSPSTDLDSTLLSWINHLERYNLYFSTPLDIDFSMLRTFFSQYTTLEDGATGPRECNDAALVSSVLGEKSAAAPFYLKLDQGKEFLKWYRYLFLGRGKPATHAIALQRDQSNDLKQDAPEAIKRLVKKVAHNVNPDIEEE